MRLLLIDHDENLHAAMLDALELAGMFAVVTQDIDGATDALDNIAVDAALIGHTTDCQDVLKIVDLVRSKHPMLPLFLLSAPGASNLSAVLNAEIFKRPLDIPKLIQSMRSLRLMAPGLA